MSNRRLTFARLARSRATSPHLQFLPGWVFLSLAANGVLLTLVGLAILRLYRLDPHSPTPAVAQAYETPNPDPTSLDLGPRHQLTYSQWVDLLAQEAAAAATKQPQRLSILAGDSLSLWFPPDLLPSDRVWLNQGISGEASAGLLDRLSIFDETEPTTIFVMIGINDLLRGVSTDQFLDNQSRIIQTLQQTHPDAQIVVQSILPHAAEQATWEGRDRLLQISNQSIQDLNQELADVTADRGAYFLNLYPLFADSNGNLRRELSTDGLHLNSQGYLVWRSALELYSQLELE